MDTINNDRVRQPIDGDPNLTDLVGPGTYIRSSCGVEGLVVDVHAREYYAGRIVCAYSIRFWSRRKLEHLAISDQVLLEDFSVFREVVVHQGRLCELLVSSSDTFEIVPIPEDVIICQRVRAFLDRATESGQLAMF